MPAEETKLKGKYHPLQFVNSQKMPVEAPIFLPKMKISKLKKTEPNREVQFDVVHHPWMRKDSQLIEDGNSSTNSVSRNRGPPKKVNGLLKSTTVRRRNRDAWDSLVQKDMVEGTSSAEDISPSKFGSLASPERKEVRTKKSPKKKSRRNEVVAVAEETRLQELPANETDDDQAAAAPPVMMATSPPVVTPIRTQRKKNVGNESVSETSFAVNDNGNDNEDNHNRSPNDDDGNGNDDNQNDNGNGCHGLENSCTASSGYRETLESEEPETLESDESSQDSSFGHTEDDSDDLLNPQNEAQEQAPFSTEKMYLFMKVTPARGPLISLAEDSPEYRSGRIAGTEETRSFRQSLQLRD